jgi:pyruvate dehydrogenase E1 component alpha subunit
MFREKQREISWTVEQLRAFESTVAETFESAAIHGPVHLSYGNEEYLIDLFQYIHEQDWVFSTWRNHYHALLHGVPAEYLMERINAGHSIGFQAPENHFLTSAIVNGIVPIAVGTALGLKWGSSNRMVWCFVGDMAGESGVFYEAVKYSVRNELPIHFVVENNGLSTNTPTQEAWGMKNPKGVVLALDSSIEHKYVSYFNYTREKYPHQGTGTWIHFVWAVTFLSTIFEVFRYI